MEKTEWPTEKKLLRLRSEGIVPYTPLSNRAFLSTVVLTFLVLSSPRFSSLMAPFPESFIRVREGQVGALALHFVYEAGYFLAAMAGLVIVSSLVWGFLQTRFAVSLSQLSPRFDRLSIFRPIRFDLILLRAGYAFILWILAILIGATSAWFSRWFLLGLYNRDERYALEVFEGATRWGFAILAIAFTAVAALAWLVGRFRFMLSHRMTKQEVASEEQH